MKLLIATLLAVFSTGAMAEWTYLTSSEDNASAVYIDKTTIRKRGNVAKMWELADHKAPKKQSDGESYLSDKMLYEHDCVEIRHRLLALTSFSGNMGSGQIIFNHQYDNRRWDDIAPGSIGMASWKAACKK
jgi:hypothetical protein